MFGVHVTEKISTRFLFDVAEATCIKDVVISKKNKLKKFAKILNFLIKFIKVSYLPPLLTGRGLNTVVLPLNSSSSIS